MAIPSSGPVSFSTIQTEFGGSNPISMNEYYAGGANVPAGTSGTYGAVPSSGTISVRNFYGTSDITPAGQIEYTRSISSGPTTLSWTCPVGVTSVSVLIIAWGRNGGTAAFTCCNYRGGVGGPGGGLVYINNLSVTPGTSYTLGFADPAQNDRFYFGTQANGYAQQGSNPGFGGTSNISGGLGVGGSGRGQGGTGRFSSSGGGSPSNANGGGGGGGRAIPLYPVVVTMDEAELLGVVEMLVVQAQEAVAVAALVQKVDSAMVVVPQVEVVQGH